MCVPVRVIIISDSCWRECDLSNGAIYTHRTLHMEYNHHSRGTEENAAPPVLACHSRSWGTKRVFRLTIMMIVNANHAFVVR